MNRLAQSTCALVGAALLITSGTAVFAQAPATSFETTEAPPHETTEAPPPETTEAPPPETIEAVRLAFEEYCVGCHGPDLEEAGMDFTNLLPQQPIVRNRNTWRRVMQMLELNRMPPEDEIQPSDAERSALIKGLDETVNQFDYSTIDDPGFEQMRRLTHVQYNNTIRDLFGTDLKPAERFPSELAGASGFDNSANTLFLQSSLMERYIGAAEGVVDVALPDEPTTDVHRAARELIFVASPDNSTSEDEAAEQILRRFLLRAFRRPPSDEEITAYLGRYEEGRAAGQGFEPTIKQVLSAVLISPKFLLRIEAGQDTDQSYRVSDGELAPRLSYVMWATMPDDELFELAAEGKLHEPDVLSAQVVRMLEDPRAETFGDVFAAQWLSFRLVGTRILFDPIDNAWCTATLMTAMRDETSMFFVSLLRENRSISELIDADYTFVNEELATTLYKLEGIEGDHMRRISVDDPNRGGILGQASVLAVTSSRKQTSPIKRGIFVLETILGTPPPAPPPNVGNLDPKLLRDRALSLREKLEQHSSDKICRDCHAKIDPMGFAMENFDFFGQWRDSYQSGRRRRRRSAVNTPVKPIDVTATLPDGTTFTGPAGLKKVIVENRHGDLVRQVASKLLAYGLGRELDYYDETAIRKIVADLEGDDFRFQTLLKSIVKSYPFQYRKNPSEEPSS